MRRGISLLEVVVVVGIVALLLAIIVPAVQSARTAARLTQCKDHLRQLGVARSDFASTNAGKFPVRWLQLYPALDARTDFVGITQAEHSGNQIPDFVAGSPVLFCPSDVVPARGRRVGYFFNDGTTVQRWNDTPRKSSGIAADVGEGLVVVPRNQSEIVDGLSNTTFSSERLIWDRVVDPGSGKEPVPPRRFPWGYTETTESIDDMLALHARKMDWSWALSSMPFDPHNGVSLKPINAPFHSLADEFGTYFDHVLPPNSRPMFESVQRFSFNPPARQPLFARAE